MPEITFDKKKKIFRLMNMGEIYLSREGKTEVVVAGESWGQFQGSLCHNAEETCSAFAFSCFNLFGTCILKLFSLPFLYPNIIFVSTLFGIRSLIISLAFGLTKLRVNFFLLDLSMILAERLSVGVIQKWVVLY